MQQSEASFGFGACTGLATERPHSISLACSRRQPRSIMLFPGVCIAIRSSENCLPGTGGVHQRSSSHPMAPSVLVWGDGGTQAVFFLVLKPCFRVSRRRRSRSRTWTMMMLLGGMVLYQVSRCLLIQSHADLPRGRTCCVLTAYQEDHRLN